LGAALGLIGCPWWLALPVIGLGSYLFAKHYEATHYIEFDNTLLAMKYFCFGHKED
jgi:hypothetical protein